MNRKNCDNWRDLLPDLAGGTLDSQAQAEMEAHLSGCEDCRRDYEVIQSVRTVLPQVPEGLEARIQARVREEFTGAGQAAGGEVEGPAVLPFRRRRVPLWGLSAAAAVVLALGTGLIWSSRTGDVVQDPIVVAAQEPSPEAWLWDDGMVAGAPVYDGLSDEDIEALLEEFEGGA